MSARNHTGKGATDEDFVIHEDTMNATRGYGKWAKEGGENPYKKMGRERREATDRGDIYHSSDYDEQLRREAERRTNKYIQEHPEDPFPPGVKHRKK